MWILQVLLFSLCLLFAASATAGGLYLTELGTPGSLGTAGVANPTNTFSRRDRTLQFLSRFASSSNSER